MKRVAVVHEDGRVLRTYDIDFGDLDREPQVHWYFKQARDNAIADKLVTESEANRIRCRFVRWHGPGSGLAPGHTASVRPCPPAISFERASGPLVSTNLEILQVFVEYRLCLMARDWSLSVMLLMPSKPKPSPEATAGCV